MSDDRYVKEPRPPDAAWDRPSTEHLDGVPYFEAPLPRRLHRCWVQTRGWIGFTLVQRCACGAIKHSTDRHWHERNSSRKAKRRPVPDTPYIERKQAEIDQWEALKASLRERDAERER